MSFFYSSYCFHCVFSAARVRTFVVFPTMHIRQYHELGQSKNERGNAFLGTLSMGDVEAWEEAGQDFKRLVASV